RHFRLYRDVLQMRRDGAPRHPDRSAPRLGLRFAVGTGHLCQIKFSAGEEHGRDGEAERSWRVLNICSDGVRFELFAVMRHQIAARMLNENSSCWYRVLHAVSI